MIKIYSIVFYLLISFFMESCKSHDDPFNFFVAGHVYGKPGACNDGVHPAFLPYLDFMGESSAFKFGFYSGDIVEVSDHNSWDNIDQEIRSVFNKPIYFTPGNHDIKDKNLYKNRYGISYKYFDYKRSRFILLDPNMDKWSISGAQLKFFNSAIESINDIDNLFVICHQVIWWRPDNKYAGLSPNSTQGYVAPPNYWNEIHPKLTALDIPVFVISGDVGATYLASSYMYDQVSNVHLLASGMGHGLGDNYLEFEISDGVVEFCLILLAGNRRIELDTFIINN